MLSARRNPLRLRHYVQPGSSQTDLIFVFDSNDRDRLEEAQDEMLSLVWSVKSLEAVLPHCVLQGVPVIWLALLAGGHGQW
eukprot:6201009-Amphidinium_carterae.1